jgi:tRNA nucleotidyltransferase/poly(A) polymerase
MSFAASFIIVKLWKQPNASQMMNELRKCSIYTQWIFIQSQKNEILSFLGKWIELDHIILKEVIQVQKPKAAFFSLICVI